MNSYVKLTPADRLILESYQSVLDGLAEYFGPGYEIVLHNLEDLDNSAIKVINGHYTGRKEGAPITDLALEMLDNIKRSGSNHKAMIYFNRSKKGAPIRSTTIPITGGKDQIIGLLCINFYMDLPLNVFLENLCKTYAAGHEESETFASNTDELILSALERAKTKVQNDDSIPSSNRNKAIVAILYQKDIFNFKDAVAKVADHLGISKNTVYLHLRNLNNPEEGLD